MAAALYAERSSAKSCVHAYAWITYGHRDGHMHRDGHRDGHMHRDRLDKHPNMGC